MRHDGDARVILGGTSPAAVASAVTALPTALAGSGPTLVPRDPRAPAPPPPAGTPGAAVVLATSGSGGRPRPVALGGAALLASATATHARLGGPGRWLLALPIHHVAGWQVLVRAHLAGRAGLRNPLAVVGDGGTFHPEALAETVAALPDDAPGYTALVPTQLVRVLAHPAAAAGLARLDAVLLGGAATPADLLARARGAGVRVVTTYGMTETAGGCVYDGLPLDGVSVAALDGRLEISGPTLALGYIAADGSLEEAARPAAGSGGAVPGEPEASSFVLRGGTRRLRTGDLGTVDAHGRVTVLGRADDVLVTGGEKVHPVPVEHLLATRPGIVEAVVVGLPDAEWGTAVTAVVVLEPGAAAPPLADLRALVGEALGRAHAPRAVVVVDRLPRRGPGKVDREAAARLAAGILSRPAGG